MLPIDENNVSIICEMFACGTPLWSISDALNITEDVIEDALILNYKEYIEHVQAYAEDRVGWLRSGKVKQPFYLEK